VYLRQTLLLFKLEGTPFSIQKERFLDVRRGSLLMKESLSLSIDQQYMNQKQQLIQNKNASNPTLYVGSKHHY